MSQRDEMVQLLKEIKDILVEIKNKKSWLSRLIRRK